MKAFGYIIGACVVLAIMRAMMAVLLIALLMAIVIGALMKPRETFGLLLFLLLAGVVQEHAVTAVVGIVALCVVGVIVKAHR